MSNARHQLRQLIRAGCGMDYVDWMMHNGLISGAVHTRFTRLFAWGTATHHPLTLGVRIARWTERRYRVQRAIRRLV